MRNFKDYLSQARVDSLPKSKTAGAGRGGQGGPTARQADEGNMTSADREAHQEIEDEKMREQARKAYNAALTSEGMKKGGKVSASKRADGIAQRGKTRGTMVMCGGGMMKK